MAALVSLDLAMPEIHPIPLDMHFCESMESHIFPCATLNWVSSLVNQKRLVDRRYPVPLPQRLTKIRGTFTPSLSQLRVPLATGHVPCS